MDGGVGSDVLIRANSPSNIEELLQNVLPSILEVGPQNEALMDRESWF